VSVLFVGEDNQITNLYDIKNYQPFINTLEDKIANCGASRSQVLNSNKVENILRTLCIKSWQSEPHQQQQNPADHCYQTINSAANGVVDSSGAPVPTWICLLFT
jgi:hypothetical protein